MFLFVVYIHYDKIPFSPDNVMKEEDVLKKNDQTTELRPSEASDLHHEHSDVTEYGKE